MFLVFIPILKLFTDQRLYRCVLGECPNGMDEGSIQWDDEHSKLDQRNRHVGELPDGNYQQTLTELKYCCSTKGDVNKPINLPNTKPFYLMTYGSPTCQKVAGTKVLFLLLYEEYL